MKKIIVAGSLGLMLLSSASPAEALSCLPIEMYLEGVIGDDVTQVFIGTASSVEVKNHTQVVTVTKALQGSVPATVLVQHPFNQDWKYFCSNGPAAAGKATIFLTGLDESGSYLVTQTFAADSEMGKGFTKMLEDAEVEAEIREIEEVALTEEEKVNVEVASTTVEVVTEEKRQAYLDLIKVLTDLLHELQKLQHKLFN